jgi:hypothetical protein
VERKSHGDNRVKDKERDVGGIGRLRDRKFGPGGLVEGLRGPWRMEWNKWRMMEAVVGDGSISDY